jgi:hypothetical protein
MNFFEATLVFFEDATDIVLKAPERDAEGIGHFTTTCLPGADEVNAPPVQPVYQEEVQVC